MIFFRVASAFPVGRRWAMSEVLHPSRDSAWKGSQMPPAIQNLHLRTLKQSTSCDKTLCSATNAASPPEKQPCEDPLYWKGLNSNQLQAVQQPIEAITRVVAGPGSGKTRVLTSRIAHLLKADPSSRILGLTFSRKAAGEMTTRLQKLIGEESRRLSEQKQSGAGSELPQPAPCLEDETWQSTDHQSYTRSRTLSASELLQRVTLGTFHSVCVKILRWNGDLLASLPSVHSEMVGTVNETVLDGGFAVVDQGEQIRIVKEILERPDSPPKGKDVKPFAVLNQIAKLRSDTSRDKKRESDLEKVAKFVRPFYRQSLLSSNSLDFDDLIYLTHELLRENQEVRDRLNRRWSHVLVDEFQDTSRVQMELVKLLTSKSLLVVGDADQSIYSWRGAHAASLSDFSDEFKGHPTGSVDTIYLMENYRSTSNIVKAAQRVISGSGGSSGADKLRQRMKPTRASGPSPRVVALKNAKEEG